MSITDEWIAPVEFRLRTRVSEAEMEQKVGKLLTEADVNVMLTGPTRVIMPNGQPLCVYLPGAIPEDMRKAAYPALHGLRSITTDNRSYAAASPGRYKQGKRDYGKVAVRSAIVGAYEGDNDGGKSYCRLTAWTGKNFPVYQETWPLLKLIATCFEDAVPDRFGTQMDYIERTQSDWVVPGTPFTTLTVNNTYPTGVHKDKGDLEAGFSCLAVLRRNITGGALCFPEWRVGAEMHDGDILLMDAHQWHGNLPLGEGVFAGLEAIHDLYSGDATKQIEPERISLVCYYRTKVQECGTADDEAAKAMAFVESKNARAGEDAWRKD